MKTRRMLLLLSLICLVAVTQCGCSWFERAAPPVDQHHAATWTLQKELIWGVLFGILGIGVGVFMLVELPFKRIGWGIVAGSGAIIAACLCVSWIVPYIGWIILGATAIGAAVFLWCKMRLKNVGRVAWDAVPDGVVIASRAESLLNKL